MRGGQALDRLVLALLKKECRWQARSLRTTDQLQQRFEVSTKYTLGPGEFLTPTSASNLRLKLLIETLGKQVDAMPYGRFQLLLFFQQILVRIENGFGCGEQVLDA